MTTSSGQASPTRRRGPDEFDGFMPFIVGLLGAELPDPELNGHLDGAIFARMAKRKGSRPRPSWRMALKRVTDTVFAAVSLIVLLPVLVGIAIAVRVDSGTPVFVRQRRVGYGSREFGLLQFRTMTTEVPEPQYTPIDPSTSIDLRFRADPRITRVGRFLRRWSLDELPQLVNVLVGDMSIVGPRAPLASERQYYRGDATQQFLLKPGMTGLWAVSGRSDLDFDERVRLDIWYVKNWSIALDIVIVFRTFRAILVGVPY